MWRDAQTIAITSRKYCHIDTQICLNNTKKGRKTPAWTMTLCSYEDLSLFISY